MRRIFLLFVLAVFVAACDVNLVVQNSCPGSVLEVKDGEGRLLSRAIAYPENDTVDLNAHKGQQITLLARGSDLKTGEHLGIAQTSIWVPRFSSSTSPDQFQAWNVNRLEDGPGCRLSR